MPDNARHRHDVAIVSPLRYPGAKRRFAGYIAEVIRLNGLKPKLFVEPFAGGASVALNLLHDEVVEEIALSDSDPLVASFLKIMFEDPDWLTDKIRKTPITLDRWDHFRAGEFKNHRDRALACLFLNRTSFSGILSPSAGPIGGRKQESDFKIDCRFPVERIAKRIEKISKLKSKVLFVRPFDWRETIDVIEDLDYADNEVFYYLDPPFYAKAERLYRRYFQKEEHTALRDRLDQLKQPWLLSYDPAQEIVDLYASNGYSKRVDLLYSASAKKSDRGRVKELVISNLDMLPKATRLWKRACEWRSTSKN